MVTLIKYTLAATLAIGSVNAATHNHRHRHVQMPARSEVEKRDSDRVQVVDGPVKTVYVLNGKQVDSEEATEGLQDGKFVVVSETPAPEAPSPRPAPTSSSKALQAEFIELKSSTTLSTTAPPSSTSEASSTSSTIASSAPTSSEKEAPTATPSPSASPAETGSGNTGLDADFPSGKISCSDFPSQYGPVPQKHLGLDSWTGIQRVSGYNAGSMGTISNIVTGISGEGCTPGSMCSYACPPGYQKSQWPSQQGAAAQSIGGIYCNSDGLLELTRPESSTLCEPGAGGVFVHNDLDDVVTTCRTDYPGTESMTIPAEAESGQTIPLCNPDQSTYYRWQGSLTSAQYYVNPMGLHANDACIWTSPSNPDSAGNWAAINIGVSKDPSGQTFIGLFSNAPTSKATCAFNIEITGDVSSKCQYVNGKFTGGGQGCTTSMPAGGKVTIRYF